MVREFLVSFGVGLGVGIFYALIRVDSPAPPLVALAGLLGMVLGQQLVSVVGHALGVGSIHHLHAEHHGRLLNRQET